MDYRSLLASIADNDAAMKSLPKEIRDGIAAAKKDIAKENAAKVKREAKVEAERDSEEQKKYNDLLCIGKWGEKVPFNRRFVLCSKVGKHFTGATWEESIPSKWEDEIQNCAIDIVRGYMSPYWGYYQYWTNGGLDQYYKERISPILAAGKAGDMDKVFREIRSEWDFFKLDGQEVKEKFSILTYHVESNGSVVVDSKSEAKTLAEHQEDLRKEFAND